MLRRAVLLITMLLVALTAGRAFWAWLGENPTHISGSAYVEFFQALDHSIELPIAITGIGSVFFVAFSAVLERRDRVVMCLLLSALALVLVANVVTVTINVPINHQIARFDPAALPVDWPTLRDRWWHAHLIRTAALLPALVLVFGAVLMRDPHRQVSRDPNSLR
ncbi:MAG: anthrone oxygenase family protein [Gammaproteobacteria bacterium]